MNGRPWTAKERSVVRQFYAEISTKEIAEMLGRTVSQVYQAAQRQQLHKSAEYLASPEARRLGREQTPAMIAHRFQKGIVPHNKGVRRPGWSVGRMAETQFKKGRRPEESRNWVPLWSTRISKDGYLEVKYRERNNKHGNWLGAHVLLWEDRFGPVPHGHKLAFKDGNKAHVVVSNLELISCAEMMRRNTIHRMPEDLRKTIMLLGAVKRKVRENAEKQNGRSAQPSL